ncbi:MAG: ABC transporter permease [Rhodospirillales bacterium]|nr:ABC transporter permease [Rhodospirillales bacterium]
MAVTTVDTETALSGNGTSPWPSRIAVAAVHFFVMVLFLENVKEDTWAAIAGFLVIHAYSVVLLRFWSRLERSAAGDTIIVTLTMEYVLIAVLFWDGFSQWPWSTFMGLVLVQLCAFAAVAYWKELRKAPRAAWFGIVVILLYVMVAATAPIIAPFGETEVVGAEYEPWGGEYLLGTDNLGRDMLTRLVFGARNTVAIAFVTTCLAFLLGGFTGLLAATLGGWIDQALSRVVDVLMAIPSLIFALLILTITGTSILSLVLVIAVLDSTRVFRLSRAVGMNVVVMEYVEAAKLRGEGLWWIIRSEILPNIMPPMVAEFGLRFCFVFLFISALSFLGLGIQPPTADWGSMVRDNATLITFGDVTPLLPAGAIALLTVGVNFVVDWFLQKTSGLKE